MEFDRSKLRKYFFPLEPIERLSVEDPLYLRLISEGKPVILTNTDLCKSALKWSLSYLKVNLGQSTYTVFESPNHVFKYYDIKKLSTNTPNFHPPTVKLELTFEEFLNRVQRCKPGGKRLYFQQPLSNTVGPAIVRDFLEFNWNWLQDQQKANEWGKLTSNLLLVGMEGNVTPVHYDEQQNFFCQLRGIKRCLLFKPEHYESLYPHPVYHPHDRQSQVDLEKPDFERFPHLRKLKGYEAIVYPGDVLYIPIYWWHHIESLHTISPHSEHSQSADEIKCNVSINFWYMAGPTKSIEYPLVSHHKLAIMRNIEKMLLDTLKNPQEVGPLLRAIVDGRYSEGAEEKDLFMNS